MPYDYLEFNEEYKLDTKSIDFSAIGTAKASVDFGKLIGVTTYAGKRKAWYEPDATEEEYNEVGDILRAAAEYMSEHGWTQGRLQNESGQVCAMGAINAVLHQRVSGCSHVEIDKRLSFESIAVAMMQNHLGIKMDGSIVNSIPSWNDAADRTAEDVILALKCAADWRPKK